MRRMLDRAGKIQVAAVAVVALSAMAGVLVWATKTRAHGDDGVVSWRKGDRPEVPPGKPRERHELPPDCEPDPAHPPKAVFDGLLPGDVLDMGDLKQGVEVEKVVTLRNAGEGDLCIADVETGCGCVKVEMPGSKRLKPGETTPIKVRVNTTAREGTITKDVTAWTNDPKRREAKFQVLLKVRLGVIVMGTPSIWFGRHAVGRPGEGKIRLKSPAADKDWTVTAVAGTKTAYDFTVAPVEPNDPEHRILEVVVRHPGLSTVDTFTDTITMKTSHPDRPEVVVSAQMITTKKYYTGPNDRVSFGFVGSGAVPVQRQVYVWPGEDGTDFAIKSVTVEGTGYEASEPKPSTNHGWVVDVRYDGKSRAEGATVEATLVVLVDDPEAEPLRVKLSGVVREAR